MHSCQPGGARSVVTWGRCGPRRLQQRGEEAADVLGEIAEEALRCHRAAFGDDPVLARSLATGGAYAWRERGDEHMWTPDAIAKLQHATRAGNFVTY